MAKHKLDLQFEGDSVWLTQKIMAELFGVDVKIINEHLQNTFKSAELSDNSVILNFLTTASDGKPPFFSSSLSHDSSFPKGSLRDDLAKGALLEIRRYEIRRR